MPRWMATCPQCNHKFTHTEISAELMKQASRDPFRIVPKPVIPHAGDKRTCPNCKNESVVHPFNLLYEST
jgi:uncharacterized protein (DUF2225 family)